MASRSQALQALSQVASGLQRVFISILDHGAPEGEASESAREEGSEDSEPPPKGPSLRAEAANDNLKPERVQ